MRDALDAAETGVDDNLVLLELTKAYVVLHITVEADHLKDPAILKRLILVTLDHLETAILELDPDNTIVQPPRRDRC
jgi:hypothetical protein